MFDIFSKSKIGSAVNGVAPRTALNAKEGGFTVKEIQARSKANFKRGSSPWDGIVLPNVRSTWLMPQLKNVTPECVGRILSSALSGESPEEEHNLYELMMQTWPRLVKNVGELKNAVCDLVWNIQDPEKNERRKHLAERTRDGMKGDYAEDGQGWRGTIAGLLDGWFTGVAVREVDWEARGGPNNPQAWLPRQTRRVEASFYGWHGETGRFGLRLPGADELSEPAAYKFIVAINNASFGHPAGGALLRSLAWYWCAANFSRDWLLSFAQLFGQPLRWATYDVSDPTIRTRLEEMMENMGAAAWACVPQGANIELKEPSNKGSDNPQKQLIDIADEACDLLILGQTLTGTAGEAGSRALGEVHYNVRSDIIDSAAAWVAEILNEQLLPSVYALNMGDGGEDAVYPYYDPASKTVKDPVKMAGMIEVLLRSGVPVVKSWAHEVTETPQPGADDEVYTAPAAGAAGMPGMGSMAGDMYAKALDNMPAQAREYFLARLKS